MTHGVCGEWKIKYKTFTTMPHDKRIELHFKSRTVFCQKVYAPHITAHFYCVCALVIDYYYFDNTIVDFGKIYRALFDRPSTTRRDGSIQILFFYYNIISSLLPYWTTYNIKLYVN